MIGYYRDKNEQKILAKGCEKNSFYFGEFDFEAALSCFSQGSLFGDEALVWIKVDKKIPKKQLDSLIEAIEKNQSGYLILHRILKSKITLQEDIDYKESLPMLCDNLNTQEREIMQIEWDFQDRKFARYLSKHLGPTYQGIIINESHPILISLTDYTLMGARVVGLNGSGVKYQKALVQIIEVNLATTKVYGMVVKVYNEGFDSKNEAISQYIVAKKQNQAKIKKQRAKEEARRIASRAKRHKRQKFHKKQKFHKRRKRNV